MFEKVLQGPGVGGRRRKYKFSFAFNTCYKQTKIGHEGGGEGDRKEDKKWKEWFINYLLFVNWTNCWRLSVECAL